MMKDMRTKKGIMALMLAMILLLSAWTSPIFVTGTADKLPEVIQEAEPEAEEENKDNKPPEATAPSEVDAESTGTIAPDEPDKSDEVHVPDVEEPVPAPSPVSGYSHIVDFDPLDADVVRQEVTIGTVLGDLSLPDTLTATVEDEDGNQTNADIPVEQWHATPGFDPQTVGACVFTPELAAEYVLENSAELPEITVRVIPGFMPVAIQQTISTYAELTAQLSKYAGTVKDMEIILASDFPTDTMTSAFTVPGNIGGYTLTIRSADSGNPAVLQRSGAVPGNMFTVNSGAHVILQDVVLDGGSDDGVTATGTLVLVNSGQFTMQAGAVLRNNNNTGNRSRGGGVIVNGNGIFTMKDGRISGNTAVDRGGGVYFTSGTGYSTTFTMEGGTISGNTANGEGGGGIFLENRCAFTMEGGFITGNTATNNASGHGGGVYAITNTSSITMTNGEISGNTAKGHGGGVRASCTFIMEDGYIFGNSANNGGGVSVAGNSSSFTMERGEITDNTATLAGGGVQASNSSRFQMKAGFISGNGANNGGGVSIAGTPFTMEGGIISDNTANRNGAGVFIASNTFTMKGGQIMENDATLDGGGVYANTTGNFTMEDGAISNNTATDKGGGVCNYGSGSFTMADGMISDNTADYGGGVYVFSGTRFTMNDGRIFLNTAGDGNGVYAENATNFTMYGGLIFGRGGSDTSVAYPATWGPDSAGDGVVIRWSGSDGDVYLYDGNENLHLLPESGAQAVWSLDTDRHGVAYARDGNINFIELPVIVQYPLGPISISGVFRYGETLSAPMILIDPPSGSWGAYTYQWTRNGTSIPGADGSTYTQVEADISHVINVTMTAQHGYAPVSSTNTVPTGKALQPAPPAFDLGYIYDPQTGVFTVIIPEMTGVEYSLDGITYDATRFTTGSPGDLVTGFMRYAETATHEIGPPTSSNVTLPIIATTVTVTGQGGIDRINTKNGTLQMLADIQPLGASQSVTWTIEAGSGATIDSAGLLTAVSDDIVTVRATATDGSGAYGEMQVTISGQSGGGPPDPPTYTVTYYANGGVGRVPVPHSVKQGVPYTIVEPALVKYDGQRFKEWNTDSTGSGISYTPGETIAMPGHNLNLYAIWEDIPEDISYTVSYYANGGVGRVPSPAAIEQGAQYKIAEPALVKSNGQRFKEWNTDSDGSGASYTPGEIIAMPAHNLNLYAIWEDISAEAYTVTFDPRGGSVSPTTMQTDAAGKLAYLPTPTRSGSYDFTGWYTAASGGVLISPAHVFTEDTMLYAHWRYTGGTGGGSSGGGSSSYTVIYDANGGIGSHKDSGLRSGSTYTIKSHSETGIANQNHSFVGWNTQKAGAGTAYDPKDTLLIKGNVTLYAQWKIEEAGPELNMEEHLAYIIGYPDETVRPNARITRGETVTIFFRLLTEESRSKYRSDTNGYIDVTGADWYNTAVSTMTNAGIISGYVSEAFEGNRFITRAEFAVIAARFDDSVYSGPDKFSDIDGHWAAEYINRAASNGWVTGYPGGTFRPEQYITRAEAMTLVNHVLDRDDFDEVHTDPDEIREVHNDMEIWIDNVPDQWHYSAIQEATNSHTYEINSDSNELWLKILPAPDWAAIERT